MHVHMHTQSCIHIIIGVILKEKMNDTSMIFTHYPGFKPDNIDAPYFKDQVSECREKQFLNNPLHLTDWVPLWIRDKCMVRKEKQHCLSSWQSSTVSEGGRCFTVRIQSIFNNNPAHACGTSFS